MNGLKVNGRFLDIPGIAAEVERKSPFFSMEEYASEATTDTINIPYTPNNALALDLPFQYYTERQKKKYEDAEYWSDDRFISKCTLVIETGKLNLNNIEDTQITGYVLFGISRFYFAIKNKKLTELSLGGPRTFSWTTNNPTDGSGGFWQHLHDTWTDPAATYTFLPIRNESWNGESGGVDWNNKLNNSAKIEYDPGTNPIVPSIRVKYVLQQIFLEHGFTIDFSGIADADWESLFFVSTKNIEFTTFTIFQDPLTGVLSQLFTPVPTVTFSLADFLPKKNISDFLLQFFFRFGIAPVFSSSNNTCRLVAAKELRNSSTVDWTKYANPIIASDFKNDAKIFALNNEVDSNDSYPVQIDFNNVNVSKADVFEIFSASTSYLDEKLVQFAFRDNKYYQLTQDGTNPLLFNWLPAGENIFNDEPTGYTDTIYSTISTLPVQFSEYRDLGGGAKRYGYFPIMKQEKSAEFGYRVVFYRGLTDECDENGNSGPPLSSPLQYPGATSLVTDGGGNIVGTWSIPFDHTLHKGTVLQELYGSRKYWWSDFLSILSNAEENLVNLCIPIQELERFSWDNRIMIANIPYLVISFVEPIPYTGIIQANLKRILPPSATADTMPPPLYAKLTVTNIVLDFVAGGAIWTSYYSCDVVVELFLDAAGTLPYTPTLAVPVYTKTVFKKNGTPYIPDGYNTFNLTAHTTVVKQRVMYSGVAVPTGDTHTNEYTLEPDPNSIYTVI